MDDDVGHAAQAHRDGRLADGRVPGVADQDGIGTRRIRASGGREGVCGNSLAGYIQAKSGRQLTFMIAVGNVPISSIAEFLQITDDKARMVAIIQQSL